MDNRSHQDHCIKGKDRLTSQQRDQNIDGPKAVRVLEKWSSTSSPSYLNSPHHAHWIKRGKREKVHVSFPSLPSSHFPCMFLLVSACRNIFLYERILHGLAVLNRINSFWLIFSLWMQWSSSSVNGCACRGKFNLLYYIIFSINNCKSFFTHSGLIYYINFIIGGT